MGTGVRIEEVIASDLGVTKQVLLGDIDYLGELLSELRSVVANDPVLAAAKARHFADAVTDALVDAAKLTVLANLEKHALERR